MGRVKELWADKIEAICQRYATDQITRDEAFAALEPLIADPIDAQAYLDMAKEAMK